ncbi:type I-U CRISPR-associated protein Csx17 [Plasticicumulans sp.]|uniref:type I-G CRISPR-associated protein Cas8g1/Csx17 n=1 Tax=Plasticicumulans sp. TaxID=2307179 RepID=UPI00392664C8
MSPTPHALLLRGCTPVPLAHYLKALGVLRLVAEQADAEATGHWTDDGFVLESRLDRTALTGFFLHDYRPTPVIAPWNGGSGFYPKDNMSGIGPLETATATRLQPYAATIRQVRTQLAAAGITTDSPKEEAKAALLARLRAALPDAALRWLDAAVVLGDGSVRYPPLLGTGGNDGRLDFTNNLMQRLVELMDPASGAPTPLAGQHLPAALFAEAAPGLLDRAIGQFQPGAAGGPNAGPGYFGSAQVNAWDFVLMLEGALLFGAAVTRRLESGDPAALAFPFAVRPRLAGVATGGAADEAAARGELWLPLWQRPCSYPELSALLAEGRVTLGRRLRGQTGARAARDGLDFARAIASYGADRGLSAFERYAFTMRAGKAYLATPLGRITVERRPAADLIADLDRNAFLDRLRSHARSDTAAAAVRSAARRLDDALFALATVPEAGEPAQRALIALGEVQRVLGASRKAHEAVPPVPRLQSDWVQRADDGSAEFRLALALAASGPPVLPMRMALAPVDVDGRVWQPDSREHLGQRALVPLLGAALRRRLLLPQPTAEDAPYETVASRTSGANVTALADFLHAAPQNVAAFDARTLALLRGLALLDPSRPQTVRRQPASTAMLPAACIALLLVFMPRQRLVALDLLDQDCPWPAPREAAARLAAGDVAGAVGLAWRRLRSAGLPIPAHPHAPPQLPGLDGPRLLAALTVPLHDAALKNLARRLLRQPAPSAS